MDNFRMDDLMAKLQNHKEVMQAERKKLDMSKDQYALFRKTYI
jgi:hypothetical protein